MRPLGAGSEISLLVWPVPSVLGAKAPKAVTARKAPAGLFGTRRVPPRGARGGPGAKPHPRTPQIAALGGCFGGRRGFGGGPSGVADCYAVSGAQKADVDRKRLALGKRKVANAWRALGFPRKPESRSFRGGTNAPFETPQKSPPRPARAKPTRTHPISTPVGGAALAGPSRFAHPRFRFRPCPTGRCQRAQGGDELGTRVLARHEARASGEKRRQEERADPPAAFAWKGKIRTRWSIEANA